MNTVDPAAVEMVVLTALALAAAAFGYILLLLALSRYEPGVASRGALPPIRARPKTLVVVLECRTREDEVGETLGRLLSLDQPRMSVLVVDDRTSGPVADVLGAVSDPRVRRVRRPDAAADTGAALNAALAHLRSGTAAGLPSDPEDVVLGVLRPGERCDADTVDAVLAAFDDPHVGLVQVGMRVQDRRQGLLARVQDVEEVLYTEVFQRGRQHFGGDSLGSAGRFVRLSALVSLGTSSPWREGRTPELDLGLRLLVAGWRSEFAASGVLHGPSPSGLGGWLSHRGRRLQRRMQCWPQVPRLLENLSGVTRAQLLVGLSTPVLLLAASLLAAGMVLWSGALAIGLARGTMALSWWWAAAYAGAVVPAFLLAGVYQESSGEPVGVWPRWRTVLLLHLYPAVVVGWSLAAWWALVVLVTGREGRGRSVRAGYAARHRKSRRGAWGWLVAPVCLVGVAAWMVFTVAGSSVQSAPPPLPSVTGETP